jgi:hypothetical protein
MFAHSERFLNRPFINLFFLPEKEKPHTGNNDAHH